LCYFYSWPGSTGIGHSCAFAPYVWPDVLVTISDTESGLFVLRPVLDWVYLPLQLRH